MVNKIMASILFAAVLAVASGCAYSEYQSSQLSDPQQRQAEQAGGEGSSSGSGDGS